MYQLYLCSSPNNFDKTTTRKLMGVFHTMPEADKFRVKWVEDYFGKSYYTRMWIENDAIVYDFGSYTQFFELEKNGMSGDDLMKVALTEDVTPDHISPDKTSKVLCAIVIDEDAAKDNFKTAMEHNDDTDSCER